MMAMLMLRDITTQKEAEEQVRASEERFRLLCNIAPIGIAISRGMNTIYVNETFVNLFGYDTASELMDLSFLELVTPECHDQILLYVAQRERGEVAPTGYEAIGLRKDRSIFNLAVDVGRMSFADDVASISFMTAITERKEAERLKDDF